MQRRTLCVVRVGECIRAASSDNWDAPLFVCGREMRARVCACDAAVRSAIVWLCHGGSKEKDRWFG